MQAPGKLEALLTYFVVDVVMDCTQMSMDFGKASERSEANPAKMDLEKSTIRVPALVCFQIQGLASCALVSRVTGFCEVMRPYSTGSSRTRQSAQERES